MSAGSALTANGTATAGMGTGVGMTAELEAALMEQALQIAPVGIASGKADYQGVFGMGFHKHRSFGKLSMLSWIFCSSSD